MSLDFNLVNVQPQLEMNTVERGDFFKAAWDSGKLESLIFNTMTIGINHLKDEETVNKFWHRYVTYYTAAGYDLYYDRAFLLSMIGLRTNASTITDAAFKKEVLERLDMRVENIIRQMNTTDTVEEA